jgi:hypothetical protein
MCVGHHPSQSAYFVPDQTLKNLKNAISHFFGLAPLLAEMGQLPLEKNGQRDGQTVLAYLVKLLHRFDHIS